MKENIAAKYAELESQLVDAFIDAQRSLDTKRMRQYAQALSPFPLVSPPSRFLISLIPPSPYYALFPYVPLSTLHFIPPVFALQGSQKVIDNYIHHNIPVSTIPL